MDTFNDRLLSIAGRLSGLLGPLTTLIDSFLERLVPQVTALANSCPLYTSPCNCDCGDICYNVPGTIVHCMWWWQTNCNQPAYTYTDCSGCHSC